MLRLGIWATIIQISQDVKAARSFKKSLSYFGLTYLLKIKKLSLLVM